MENLNSDEKMSIFMKLTGEEIIKVCQTSKNMSRICNDERFTALWRNKIREEFNVEYNGTNGYEKYKYLYMLYKQTFYAVIDVDMETALSSDAILFDTREKAEGYILAFLGEYFTYSQLISTLRITGHISFGSTVYRIDERKMNNNFTNYDREAETYQLDKEEFLSLFGENRDDAESRFEDEFTEIYNEIESHASRTKILKLIKSASAELAEEFDVEQSLISDYLLKMFLSQSIKFIY